MPSSLGGLRPLLNGEKFHDNLSQAQPLCVLKLQQKTARDFAINDLFAQITAEQMGNQQAHKQALVPMQIVIHRERSG